MTVWIAYSQYDYEGMNILAVYDSEEKAQARIDEERRENLKGLVGGEQLDAANEHELRELCIDLKAGPDLFYAEEEVL